FKRHKMESGIRIPYLNVGIESKRLERASSSRKRCVNWSSGSKAKIFRIGVRVRVPNIFVSVPIFLLLTLFCFRLSQVSIVILFYGPGYRAVFSNGILISTWKNPLNPNIPAKFPNSKLLILRALHLPSPSLPLTSRPHKLQPADRVGYPRVECGVEAKQGPEHPSKNEEPRTATRIGAPETENGGDNQSITILQLELVCKPATCGGEEKTNNAG
ncbi:hypothetical protein PIB30_069830, partial [Stylosanthes scabra]|nr:hypothetical protein [Stylosanthes scabra]